jgi:GntR family transcriptional regulator
VDEELVEKKRGLGMFVKSGARDLLLQGERRKFLAEQWPRISATIQRLGLDTEELLKRTENGRAASADKPGDRKAPTPTGAKPARPGDTVEEEER